MGLQTKTTRTQCAKTYAYIYIWQFKSLTFVYAVCHTLTYTHACIILYLAKKNIPIQIKMPSFCIRYILYVPHIIQLSIHFHQYFVSSFLIFCWFTHMGAYIHTRAITPNTFSSLSATLLSLCSLQNSFSLSGRLYVVFVYIILCSTQWCSLSRALSLSLSPSLSLSLTLCASLVVVASTVVFVLFPLFCILAMRLLFCRLSCQYLQ